MKLAEDIFIVLASETVELRPSLRHAIRLERREGGFRQLFQEISEGSLSAAIAIVDPHYDGDMVEHRIMDTITEIRPALIAYVLACAGIDPDKPSEEKPLPDAAKKQPDARPYSVYLADLYKFGTGWLGWTPDQTLDATPAEITLAFDGHVEKLKAIHGKSEPQKGKDTRPIEEKFRSIFTDLGTQKEGAEA